MKRLFFLFGSLFALAACAPPAPPPPPAALEPPAGATTYFDGSYTGQSIQNISGVTPVPCAKFSVAPALTIGNGVARFAALDLTFQGYVTPQGTLTMQSGGGQSFEGQMIPILCSKAG